MDLIQSRLPQGMNLFNILFHTGEALCVIWQKKEDVALLLQPEHLLPLAVINIRAVFQSIHKVWILPIVRSSSSEDHLLLFLVPRLTADQGRGKIKNLKGAWALQASFSAL